MRISKLQVQFNENTVDVYFTLYEKTNFYGNVLRPVDDVLLKDALKNLKDAFSNNLEISVLLHDNQVNKLKINQNKFIKLFIIFYLSIQQSSQTVLVSQ